MTVEQQMQMAAMPAADGTSSQGIANGGPQSGQTYDQSLLALQVALGQAPPSAPSVSEVDEKKKKGSAYTATNDKELREMLVRNDGRALKEVAAEVIATERTPKAEKSKQLFAMLWLKSTCRSAKNSVPRNRVYSHYAERCGTERVIPLNPASFGKLVRVIFPGIQTRRLGVRGESKYHYVDLALVDDSQDLGEAERPQEMQRAASQPIRQGSTSNRIDFNTMPRLPADTAVFPPQENVFDLPTPEIPSAASSKGRLFADTTAPRFKTTGPTSDMYSYDLKFPSPDQTSPEENVHIELPDIRDYLPAKTDPDAAQALTALYRTHCTSLIDSIRYCKEKQFYRLFASFHGTLTVPVQKLFAHPDIAPWVKECDWMMYQKMIRNVSQLTLQVAPPAVLHVLDKISKTLHAHISKVFQGLPLHVLEARLEPATLFAHLLRRMLRVNSAAHAAAVMLLADQNRDAMWEDWTNFVNVKQIIESQLPDCGYEEVYSILTKEIRGLLLPLNKRIWLNDGSYYPEPINDPNVTNVSNDTVIDRLAAFLSGLPSRFPHANTRTLLYCINALSTAVIREITVENGTSYGSWWITKVFIDEMCQWLASLGGFLDHKPPTIHRLSYSPGVMDGPLDSTMMNGGSGSNNDSRYSSIGADFNNTQSFVSMGDDTIHTTATPASTDMNAQRYQEHYNRTDFGLDLNLDTSQPEPDHDDSGIGMSGLLDDGMDLKYSMAQGPNSSHFTSVSTDIR
ncbi:uncharacterized protein BDZ99DRAFT_462234 [Mytilinidion resinicola]|uniref:RFX-type winged-helix domain-containing protein n=1 Tax=Mytilinidion resinicola TaxID=574789 RepID=A0A6A6YSK6_9PEZI|nr:uncharacterized protein BDZ99DRAFT_462234 [Mytilinidion resinicola]KAF2810945.1 hypothetical protein BDZ99DRAFT_462234 [Mytilinidion resinicola]